MTPQQTRTGVAGLLVAAALMMASPFRAQQSGTITGIDTSVFQSLGVYDSVTIAGPDTKTIHVAPKSGLTTVCWTEPAETPGAAQVETCVPWAILQVTFLGWKPGDASPAKNMIDLQRQWAATLSQYRACEGELAPLAAAKHGTALNAQQQALDAAMAAHAPAGMTWDAASGSYVPKPAEKTPLDKKSGG